MAGPVARAGGVEASVGSAAVRLSSQPSRVTTQRSATVGGRSRSSGDLTGGDADVQRVVGQLPRARALSPRERCEGRAGPRRERGARGIRGNRVCAARLLHNYGLALVTWPGSGSAARPAGRREAATRGGHRVDESLRGGLGRTPPGVVREGPAGGCAGEGSQHVPAGCRRVDDPGDALGEVVVLDDNLLDDLDLERARLMSPARLVSGLAAPARAEDRRASRPRRRGHRTVAEGARRCRLPGSTHAHVPQPRLRSDETPDRECKRCVGQ